jgi:hypothetical protein
VAPSLAPSLPPPVGGALPLGSEVVTVTVVVPPSDVVVVVVVEVGMVANEYEPWKTIPIDPNRSVKLMYSNSLSLKKRSK